MAVECVSASSSPDVLTYTDKFISKSRDMLEIFIEFKINDEPSDRVTVNVNATIAEVPQIRRSRRTLGRGTHSVYGPWLFCD